MDINLTTGANEIEYKDLSKGDLFVWVENPAAVALRCDIFLNAGQSRRQGYVYLTGNMKDEFYDGDYAYDRTDKVIRVKQLSPLNLAI